MLEKELVSIELQNSKFSDLARRFEKISSVEVRKDIKYSGIVRSGGDKILEKRWNLD